MQDLAAVLGVKKASVSTAISKLERRGLVNRFPCKLDARAQHLVLTDTARSALAQEAMVYGQLDSWVQEHGLGDALEALAGALDQPAPATQHGS